MQVNQVRAGAILSYVSMAVSTILSLVYAPIMKGQLGTSEYGVYGSVGPIIAYLLLLSMGLGSAYMRYYSQAKVAQDRRTMAKLNGMFLVTYTVLGLVLLVLGFTLAAHPQNVFGAKWTEEELALGAKLRGTDERVYTLLGDGEIEEGECWEAFMFANHYKLDNLCIMIDVNGLQIDGATRDVMNSEPLDHKMDAFGFNTIVCNGNSF